MSTHVRLPSTSPPRGSLIQPLRCRTVPVSCLVPAYTSRSLQARAVRHFVAYSAVVSYTQSASRFPRARPYDEALGHSTRRTAICPVKPGRDIPVSWFPGSLSWFISDCSNAARLHQSPRRTTPAHTLRSPRATRGAAGAPQVHPSDPDDCEVAKISADNDADENYTVISLQVSERRRRPSSVHTAPPPPRPPPSHRRSAISDPPRRHTAPSRPVRKPRIIRDQSKNSFDSRFHPSIGILD